MQVAVFGRDLTLTLGTGPDFSLCDVLINGLFWNSVDNYAATNGEQAIAISLTQEGPHTVEIRNRADKNPASTGYRFRFKSLVTAASTPLYDLHTIKYTYDALSRVIDAKYYPGQNTGLLTPTRTYTFRYDVAGNRIYADNNGTVTNYSYNALNQLSGTQYEYDPSGRLTTNGTETYAWDRANRLLSMGSSAYLYNGMGQRIQQSVGAAVTKYLLDTQPGLFQTLTETTGVNVTRYVQGPTGLQQIQQASGVWQQVISDALGSVRGVVDANNSLLDTRLYAPYGESWGASGTSQTGYGFTGEPTDDNGLVYLRARYYNPALGVFTGLDGFETNNRYQYVSSNPINSADPSGLLDWFTCKKDSGVYSCLVEEGDSLDEIAWTLGLTRRWSNGSIVEDFQWALINQNGTGPESAVQYNRWAVKWRRLSEIEKYYLVPDRWLKIPNQVKGVFGGYTNVEKIITRGQERYLPPVATGTIISGYVEGIAGISNIPLPDGAIGIEVVYNFATFQRMEFEYVSLSASTVVLGASAAIYAGHVEGFRRNKKGPLDFSQFINQYAGDFTFLSIGLGAVVPIINRGLGAGIMHFHTPVNGSPQSVYGNALYAALEAGQSILGPVEATIYGIATYKPRLATGKSYIKENCRVDRTELVRDILAGNGSPLGLTFQGLLSSNPAVVFRVPVAQFADNAAKNYNEAPSNRCC